MACPDCGSSFGECRFARSVETHGLDCGPYERFEQEYVVCRGCGGNFDISDWENTSDLVAEEAAADRNQLRFLDVQAGSENPL